MLNQPAKGLASLQKSSRSGFTLIELMVALGLFAFVMSISTGAYVIMIATNRQAQAVATGSNNLSYALEVMTRNIRTGSGYDCSTNSYTLTFTDAYGALTTYTLAPSPGGQKIVQTSGSVTTDLTDQNVVLSSTGLRFECGGQLKTDSTQANVTIIVSGSVSSGPGKTVPFFVETSATRRGIDL
jgi:prepilin-type N-terminal cleavage/methylation domain-containing protein